MSVLREFWLLGVSGDIGPLIVVMVSVDVKQTLEEEVAFHHIFFCMAVCAATCLPRSSTQRVYDDLYMARAL